MKEFFGPHSLRSLIRLVQSALGLKVDKADIVNNLTTNDAYKPLSAAQGAALKESLDKLDADNDGIVDDASHLGGKPASDYALAADIKNNIDDQKGQPNGVVPLNESGKIDADYLPSYVDDIVDIAHRTDPVEGEETVDPDKWYVVDADGNVTEEEVTFERGKIYVDVDEGTTYRWTGAGLTTVGGDGSTGGFNEITASDIQAMWDEIAGENDDPATGGEEETGGGEEGGENNPGTENGENEGGETPPAEENTPEP